jgi:ribosomal protein S18 acetylase RimI-like enzyme
MLDSPKASTSLSSIRIEGLSPASDAAAVEAGRALLLEYGRFVLESEGPARFCFGKLEQEVAGLPDGFAAQRGELLLAWVDGVAAGCVTYRALSAGSDTGSNTGSEFGSGACEMKRLWVRPAFRGSGLGERLVEALLERARDAGFKAVCLDTVPANMGSAYRMYLRLGFAECAPYHENFMDGLTFMRRSLE